MSIGQNNDYYASYTAVGGQLISPDNAQPGDILQKYNPANHYDSSHVHTAIILGHSPGTTTFSVIDQNENYNLVVGRNPSYNPWANLAAGWAVAIWRVGTVSSIGGRGSMAVNGGFESGWGPWTPMASTNFVVYGNGQVSGESARSAVHYAATNTSAGGGGIYQDVPVSASPGQLYCASAWVRTQAPATGSSGSFVVWLLGGAYNESGVASFSGLSNGSNWRQVQTCVAASTAHSAMRIQFYPGVNAPTLEVDDVDVHASMAVNGGFESGWGPWTPMASTNFVVYGNGQVSGESARSAVHYAATNTSAGGGGIYQDVPVSASPGQLYCASAWVRTQAPATGSSGSFVVWLLGGAYNESGVASFSGLSNGSNWRQVQTCVAASTAHSAMRIQFYPGVNAPTLEVDDVDVH